MDRGKGRHLIGLTRPVHLLGGNVGRDKSPDNRIVYWAKDTTFDDTLIRFMRLLAYQLIALQVSRTSPCFSFIIYKTCISQNYIKGLLGELNKIMSESLSTEFGIQLALDNTGYYYMLSNNWFMFVHETALCNTQNKAIQVGILSPF